MVLHIFCLKTSAINDYQTTTTKVPVLLLCDSYCCRYYPIRYSYSLFISPTAVHIVFKKIRIYIYFAFGPEIKLTSLKETEQHLISSCPILGPCG